MPFVLLNIFVYASALQCICLFQYCYVCLFHKVMNLEILTRHQNLTCEDRFLLHMHLRIYQDLYLGYKSENQKNTYYFILKYRKTKCQSKRSILRREIYITHQYLSDLTLISSVQKSKAYTSCVFPSVVLIRQLKAKRSQKL